MFTLFRKIFGVFAIGIIYSVACDSASTTIPADTAQQADCLECRMRERVESAQPGDTIDIAAGDGSYPPLDQRGVSRPRGASCDIASYER